MASGDDSDGLRRIRQLVERTYERVEYLQARVDDLSRSPMETVSVGDVSHTAPVIRSLNELMDAVGGEAGKRHGEAVARGEIATADAWQIAMTALAHLRKCIGEALQATPPRADSNEDSNRGILELAHKIGEHWRAQGGVNGALLDDLAQLTAPMGCTCAAIAEACGAAQTWLDITGSHHVNCPARTSATIQCPLCLGIGVGRYVDVDGNPIANTGDPVRCTRCNGQGRVRRDDDNGGA